MARAGGGFDFPEHAGALQEQAFALAIGLALFRGFLYALGRGASFFSILLLLFDGFAFKTSGHPLTIIRGLTLLRVR